MSSGDPAEDRVKDPLEDGNDETMAEEQAELEEELAAAADAPSTGDSDEEPEEDEAEESGEEGGDEVAASADDAEDESEEESEEEGDEEADSEGPEISSTGEEIHKEWYVLKVTSNREDSIRDAIVRRIKILNLEEYVGEVVVPTEKVTEIKDGKKRVVERKFYPGYIMIHLDLNDDTWFAIRETPGVGDFVGAGGKPVPMTEHDVAKMLNRQEEAETKAPSLKINFQKGDRVKIKEGTFENFEGDVEEVNEAKGLVRVMIKIFNRPTPVELEYWQVETV